MNNSVFVGRKKELAELKRLQNQAKQQVVVIKGRRRIGKSRLISYYANNYAKGKLWDFAGIAPQGNMDAQSQRDHFARQLATQVKLPPFTFNDWSDAFEHLSSYIKSGDIILFDEISWMGAKDASFVPKLKAWCDKLHVAVMVVLCGSVSTWIEANILRSTAFFGRVNHTITLEPLPIIEASELLKACGYQGSYYDMYKLLSVFGGVPWYLEQVSAGYNADQMLKLLCFEKNGLLVVEFDRIFHDLFDRRGEIYEKIMRCLADGAKTLAEVRTAIAYAHSGTLSNLIEYLIVAGFIQKHDLWSFKTEKPLKQSLYRLSDPYMRFYLKMIEPRRNKIANDVLSEIDVNKIPGFDAHIGFQIEQLLIQNRGTLLAAIGISPSDIVADGPYRQTKTSIQSGCQIDYLIQTATKNLYICEFKFKRRELGLDIVNQVKDKIKALAVPRGFAVIPILFHIGGVSSHVEIDGFFYRIIDIGDFLEQSFYA